MIPNNSNVLTKIVTYNCYSVRKSIDIVRELIKLNDIVILQEILLLEEDLHFLDNIDNNFACISRPSRRANSVSGLDGRPVGGLAILYKKTLDFLIKEIVSCDNYLAVVLETEYDKCCLFNVYMPCDVGNDEIINLYLELLGSMHACMIESNIDRVIMAGDFNADPSKGRFWNELRNFVCTNNLIMCDANLSGESFTYLSPAHNSTSWLDHIVSSQSISVSNVNILYDCVISDHIPVMFSIDMCVTTDKDVADDVVSNDFIDWTKFNDEQKEFFNVYISQRLNSYSNISFHCQDMCCNSIAHKDEVCKAYDFFVDTLKRATSHLRVVEKRKFVCVPGWNDHCRSLYSEARRAVMAWYRSGRLRVGPIYICMKSTRAAFRRALNFCKRNELQIKSRKLAESFNINNNKLFWKEIKKITNTKSNNVIQSIDNISDPSQISEVFKKKFNAVFDDKDSQTIPPDYEIICNQLNNNKDSVNKLRYSDIVQALKHLKTGIGYDGIHTNHLKCMDRSSIPFLVKLFNCFLVHSFLPPAMLKGVIKPIIKDRYGNKKDSNNYRPIMLSSNCFKLFEYALLPRLKSFIQLNSCQFAYRPNTSTHLATVLLKELVGTYVEEGSTVYAGFLDFSKAFDKVNHKILIRKLYSQSVPCYLIRIISAMFDNTLVNVNFNNIMSNSFSPMNGVRQGGVLSSLLFCFYIDGLLSKINNMKIGCRYGLAKMNIQAYADDIVVLSPSFSGLQQILDVVAAQVTSLGLTLNETKSITMIFRPRGDNILVRDAVFTLNGKALSNVDEVKYLGMILKNNCSNASDIDRCRKKFLMDFGYLLRKFYFIDSHILVSLLHSFCLGWYGAELWTSSSGCSAALRQFSVAYHNAIKKIIGVTTRSSNHVACNHVNMPTFKHLLNRKLLGFMFFLKKCSSPCFSKFKYQFMNHSLFVKEFNIIFYREYNLINILDNDKDALLARISFVQSREDYLR